MIKINIIVRWEDKEVNHRELYEILKLSDRECVIKKDNDNTTKRVINDKAENVINNIINSRNNKKKNISITNIIFEE